MTEPTGTDLPLPPTDAVTGLEDGWDAPSDGVLVGVDVEGFRGEVHVRADGPTDAPVLLALHGFSGSLYWWGPVTVRLQDAVRIVRVDLLGHGDTRGPAADAPVQARVVEAVLAHLGIESAAVVGHSFGADVAATLAESSSRVERLAIICQAPDYSDAHLPFGRELMTSEGAARHLMRVAVLAARGAVAVRRRRRPDAPDLPLADRAVRDLAALDPAMFRVVLVDRRRRMELRPLDAQVRDAGKPTLVVLGARDHYYGARSAGRYRTAGAHVVVLPTSDHSPLMDMPDRIASLLRDFVLPSG